MNELKAENIVRVPVAAASRPRNGHSEILVEYTWIVDPAGEGSLIFYKRFPKAQPSPQCNSSERIVRRVLGGLWEPFGFEPRLIPVTFLPITMFGDVDFRYNLVPLL